jgi:2-iminobutanoate/2-iminopropanoate deaminase
MTQIPVLTQAAPRPRGPYSQAIQAGGFIFVAGQLPIDAAGTLIGLGDIRAQTQTVIANIDAILTAAGSSLSRVVKTTVFLASLDDFSGMNDVYAAAFRAPYPARSTVEVSRLPEGMLIEIECIALA